ncbi:hypothetical protein ABVG11_32175 [Streptomyces sp. HD1123-B1]|uniref:hypothetical protein n=1 Tax=Streptomyces huangiella TaxID=3228804 RepID=UPI003D7DDD26
MAADQEPSAGAGQAAEVNEATGVPSRRTALTGLAVTALAASAATAGPAWAQSAPSAHGRGHGRHGWIEESFFCETPKDVIVNTHGGLAPAAPFPPGVARFTDARLKRTLAFGGLLRDAEGAVVGYGTELETLLPESTPESGIMRSRSAWLLHLPGRGTIFYDEVEDKTDVAATIFQPALESGKPWVGDRTVVSTVGPGKDGRGVISGGTEEFEGIRGSGVERARVRRFDPVALVMEATFELRFRYRLPH